MHAPRCCNVTSTLATVSQHCTRKHYWHMRNTARRGGLRKITIFSDPRTGAETKRAEVRSRARRLGWSERRRARLTAPARVACTAHQSACDHSPRPRVQPSQALALPSRRRREAPSPAPQAGHARGARAALVAQASASESKGEAARPSAAPTVHAAIPHLSSLISHQSSLIGHHSAVITHQSSIISHHSSVITHQS